MAEAGCPGEHVVVRIKARPGRQLIRPLREYIAVRIEGEQTHFERFILFKGVYRLRIGNHGRAIATGDIDTEGLRSIPAARVVYAQDYGGHCRALCRRRPAQQARAIQGHAFRATH